MKPLSSAALAVALAIPGVALAAPGNAGSPPGQDKRPVDPDQGDDNASETAVLKVSSKDTPAAERSAIVPTEPDSP